MMPLFREEQRGKRHASGSTHLVLVPSEEEASSSVKVKALKFGGMGDRLILTYG
jgi:hypothetical protein